MSTDTFWFLLLAALAIIALAMLGMSLGVMATGRCLRGSCGGAEVRLANGTALSCADCPNRRKSVQRTPLPDATSD